jgi:hypothetical protein
VDGPQWQALFDASNDLVGCGHMSGLLVRSVYPLALMKSDDRGSHQECELRGSHDWPGFSWSSVATVVVHHLSWRLPNLNLQMLALNALYVDYHLKMIHISISR